MTASQFDAWLSNLRDGSYRGTTKEEMNARTELHALRMFVRLTSEIKLLRDALGAPPILQTEDPHSWRHVEARLHTAEQEINQVHVYLIAAKWELPLDIQHGRVGSADAAQ